MRVEDVQKVCVLGAGAMGAGIAQVCAQAGFAVAMRDIEQRFVDAGATHIVLNLRPPYPDGIVQRLADEVIPHGG